MVRRLLITIPALVGLLAALSCNALNLLRFHGPASVLASHEFDVVVAGTGSMSSAVGGQVGVVLQLPPGVTALRAAASSPQDVLSPVAMNAPGPMGVFTAEPGHSLASFSGDAGTSNQLVRLLRATLRAPDTPTTLVIKAALTRPDPNSGNWIVDGSQSNQFSLITNPDHQIQVEVVAAPDPAGTGLMWTHAQTGLDPSLIGTPQHFDVGDIDGDGRDDLAMVTTLSNVTNVITRLSRPGGAWVTSGVGLPGHVNGATSPRAALGDVDGDGLAELAKPDGTIWSRSVNGTWTIVGLAGVASSASQVFAGDFDGDGWDDFCFLESAAVRVFLSLGNGTLGFAGMMTINNVAGGLTPAAKVRIGDLDGDGDD
ncbi:MAG: VCBS repeat-containing protein, partial [Salinibacterium sp.]|nr:VCBS repeat-containing protein [Salinibacterium sp.]